MKLERSPFVPDSLSGRPAADFSLLRLCVLAGVNMLLASAVFAQDFKDPTAASVFGAPRASTASPGEPASGTDASKKAERPLGFYPSLRLNNLSPRLVVETAPTEKGDLPASGVPPVGEMSDFERMVLQTLGVQLPVYARNLFQKPEAPFNVGDQGNVPADFVIGPGDDLIIRAWGSIELEYAVTVDRRGAIFIPKLGNVQVAGLAYKDLQPLLQQALARIYRGFELSVSMGTLRSFRMYVTGYARTPGAYQVTSLSTLISALFLTGGPSPQGDLRSVELRRGGQVVGRLDLYDFLINGNRNGDLRLQSDDVIHIPPMKGQVAVTGSIRNGAIYQLKPGMTLGDLLKLSGGVTSTADSLRITLERVAKPNTALSPSQSPPDSAVFKTGRFVQQLSASAEDLKTVLRDGDLVIVVPISPQFSNAVTLKGQVALPLRYAWSPGLRVADVIPDVKALVSPAYWIEKNASSKIASFLTDPSNVNARPTFPEINWAYAVVERVLPDSLQVTLLPFQLDKAIFERDPQHNLPLQPGDTITVFSRKDFRGPLASSSRFIKIEGEVKRPGLYQVGERDTLSNVLNQAGGVTPLAYLYGTQLLRESLRVQQQRRIDEAINGMELDFARNLIERAREVSTTEEVSSVPAEGEAIRSFLDSLRKAKPEGRMVLDLTSQIQRADQLPALRLEDQDVIYVPLAPESVEVVGAVMAERSFIWKAGRDVEDYIRLAGGRRESARRGALVVRPDGTLIAASDLPREGLVPGDTVWVEEKTNRVSWTRRIKDVAQIVYQFGLGLAGIRVVQGN